MTSRFSLVRELIKSGVIMNLILRVDVIRIGSLGNFQVEFDEPVNAEFFPGQKILYNILILIHAPSGTVMVFECFSAIW
jgi:hypothetical protein